MKNSCFEFELRGQVGLLCGLARLKLLSPTNWLISGIHVYSPIPGLYGRDLEHGSEEYRRTKAAILRQDGEKISLIGSALLGHEMARAS